MTLRIVPAAPDRLGDWRAAHNEIMRSRASGASSRTTATCSTGQTIAFVDLHLA